MNFKKIDLNNYYRKDAFIRFSKGVKCSFSMTTKIDVSKLYEFSKRSNTKFYINFLYIVTKVINSRDDFKMSYLSKSDELICYEKVNPIQYIFHEETKTISLAYSTYYEDYKTFYKNALNDIEVAKKQKTYGFDPINHPNWFDASVMPFSSYESFNIELPDGNIYLAPIVNWGKYKNENGKLIMPVTIRLNHAICDGYHAGLFFNLIEKEIQYFVE